MFKGKWLLWLAAAAALSGTLLSWHLESRLALAAAIIVAVSLAALWSVRRRIARHGGDDEEGSLLAHVQHVVNVTRGLEPEDSSALVDEMLAHGRYALLLRPQIVGNLSQGQLEKALRALVKNTALVPKGQLCVGLAGKETDDGDEDLPPGGRSRLTVAVDDFLIDRYAVTNRQFQHFVSQGGYTNAALWDAQIWPAVVDFVDRTGCPGPRFWKDGRFPAGEQDHPVVGISWFEAAAYARWVGKRLPSDPEWEKSGSWPVPLDDESLLQRRYPWGDSMDRSRANLWGSGPNKIVPVDQFATGASAGGIVQLIGNIWEWTNGFYGAGPYQMRGLAMSTPLRSIRGGAYDTYFDSEATCQFQSGENPVSRKHNIGFRCAVSTCDLAAVAHHLFNPEGLETTEEQVEAVDAEVEQAPAADSKSASAEEVSLT